MSQASVKKGKLVIFSAPSGAGKTTIVRHLLNQDLNLEFSISATSREPRINETNGRDYYFLTEKDFKEKVKNNEFIEWEEVYSGTCYGTLKNEVERIRNSGKNLIFDVDVIGGLNIKKMYNDDALAIFIQPPTIEELTKRLTNRSTESEENIKIRIAKAEYEMGFANQFDVIIINDDLQNTLNQAENLIRNFLDKVEDNNSK